MKDRQVERHTGTCRAVVWMGAVRAAIPAGFCTVDRTWVPSGFRVVRTRESVFKIWGWWTRTLRKDKWNIKLQQRMKKRKKLNRKWCLTLRLGIYSRDHEVTGLNPLVGRVIILLWGP